MMKLAAIWPRTRNIGTPDGCAEPDPLASLGLRFWRGISRLDGAEARWREGDRALPRRRRGRDRFESDLRQIVVGAAGERGVHRALHGPAGRPFVDELHLGFGGVNVDVDRRWIEADVDGGQRMPSHEEERVVRLLQGEGERPVLHPAAVDEDDDALAMGTRQLGGGDPAVDGDPWHGGRLVERFQRDRRASDLRAPGGRRRGDGIAGASGGEGATAVDHQLEGDGRVGGRVGGNGALDVAGLGRGLAQELAASGDVGEEIAGGDRGALAGADRHRRGDLAERDAQE